MSSSSKQRARASAEAFLQGFYNSTMEEQVEVEMDEQVEVEEEQVEVKLDELEVEVEEDQVVVEEDDQLLRFYDRCPKYQEEVSVVHPQLPQVKGSYKAAVAELERSPAFLEMVARVGRRAGVELTLEEITLVWNICRWPALATPRPRAGSRWPGTLGWPAPGAPCSTPGTSPCWRTGRTSSTSTSSSWPPPPPAGTRQCR